MSKSAAARLFGVSLSSVIKRYARIANQGASLTPRNGGGRPPKTDQTIRRLAEENIHERPGATIADRCRFLQSATSKSLSDSTVKRLLKKMGFSEKTECGATERDEFQRAAWWVMVAEKADPKPLVWETERKTQRGCM
jgi:transposase